MVFGGEGGNCRAGGNAGIGDGIFDGGGLGRQLLTSVWAATSLAATLLPSEAVLVITAAQKRTRPMARALVVIATIFHRRPCRRVLAADRDARGEERSWIHVYV